LIRIKRDRTDEHGRPIRPDDAWFDKAKDGRALAEAEAARHDPDPDIYAADQVKAALEELFHDKCAYCETKITASADWDVEHFRPKGKVAERSGHPGYYWLTYEWSNLYPSCPHCNQRRKDRPRWGDLRHAEAGGKGDQFPLDDEGTRTLKPGDDPKREARLLLDPCEDQPESHLRYMVDGQIVAVAGDRRGEASIEVFHLARRRLRDARREVITAAIFVLKFIRKYEAEGQMEAAADFHKLLATSLLADRCQYAGAARAVTRDPDAFGV
jgi:uncharacterized protein (TIGR02646 family)